MASISVDDLKKMKVNDLKKELKERGLPTSGTKDVLLKTLQAALQQTEVSGDTIANSAADDCVEESIDQLVGDSKASTAPVVIPAKENIPSPEPTSQAETKKLVSVKSISEADRLKARAEKFGGAVSDSAKKLMRAERFGLPVTTSGSTDKTGMTLTKPEDMDKMKKRAERFGMVVSNKLSKVDEDEKKRKRLARFGEVSASSTETKKVKLNSTDSDMEERKKKRAERFGLT